TSSFSDPDADTWTGTVNFGDGSGDQPLTLNPDKTFAFRHVFTITGIYNVVVTVADDHGGVGTQSLGVSVVVATLESDPLDPSHPLLAVGGTARNDTIRIVRGIGPHELRSFVNGIGGRVFTTAGRIVIYGQDGNDVILVGGGVTNSAWLFRGGGQHPLHRGARNTVTCRGDAAD